MREERRKRGKVPDTHKKKVARKLHPSFLRASPFNLELHLGGRFGSCVGAGRGAYHLFVVGGVSLG